MSQVDSMLGVDAQTLIHYMRTNTEGFDLDEAKESALNAAIISLERDIPRLAKEHEGNYYCKLCYMKVYKNFNYCPNCGTKLVFKEDKEENNESQSLEQSGEIQSGESGDELQNSEGLEA